MTNSSFTDDDLEATAKEWLQRLTGSPILSNSRIPQHVAFRLAAVIHPDDAVWWDLAWEQGADGQETQSGRVVAITAAEVLELVFENSINNARGTEATGMLTIRRRRDITAVQIAGTDFSSYLAKSRESSYIRVGFRDGGEVALPLSLHHSTREILDVLRAG